MPEQAMTQFRWKKEGTSTSTAIGSMANFDEIED